MSESSPMKLSELIAKLTDELEANGDADHVALAVTVAGPDGSRHRLDAHIERPEDFEVVRDSNITGGLACIVADHKGNNPSI